MFPHFQSGNKINLRKLLTSVMQYITMRIMSILIFVSHIAKLDLDNLLPRVKKNKTIRLSLTKIYVGTMLNVMDHLRQPSLKSLHLCFHTTVKRIDATGCILVRKKHNVLLWKRSVVMRTVYIFFAVIGLKHAPTQLRSINLYSEEKNCFQ